MGPTKREKENHPQKCRLVGDMLVSRRVIYYRFIAGFIRFIFVDPLVDAILA